MADLRKLDECTVSVDGSLTFAGVIAQYFDEMCVDNYWKSVINTQTKYIDDYVKRIIPCIYDHDQKPMEEFTYEDYKQIIERLKEGGYSPERIAHFMRLIDAVAVMAQKKLGIENALWGTVFEYPDEDNVDEKIKELVTLKKSLSPTQE